MVLDGSVCGGEANLTEMDQLWKVLAGGSCTGGEEAQNASSSGGEHMCDLVR